LPEPTLPVTRTPAMTFGPLGELSKMWNWIAAFGVTIEFLGFATLAVEIVRTLKSDILDNVKITRKRTTLNRMVVSDGVEDEAGIALEGGQLEELIKQINSRQSALRERMQLIMIGAGATAIGCAMQVVGSFGQALQIPPS
jgi:hypothetical protein